MNGWNDIRNKSAPQRGRNRTVACPRDAAIVTCCDHNMVMMKGVGIADLKARLSEHLGAVRRGRTVTVLDRGTPVARIVPYRPEGLEVRRATRKAGGLTLPPGPARKTNSLAALMADRKRR